MTLRIAIIGAGRIAHSHAQAIARAAGVDLVAVVDQHADVAERFARQYNAGRGTSDIGGTLRSDQIDAVVVCSPTALHRDHGIAALRAGKHTLIEKPFAADPAEATELVSIADELGLKLMSGQVLRFMPMFSLAKEFMDSGRLGAPAQSVERRLTFRRDNFPWWAQLPQFLISHWGSHSLDLLCYLLDEPVDQVYCSATSVISDYGVVDDFTLYARFQSRFRSAIAMSFSSRYPVHDLVIVGTEATLQFDGYQAVSVNGEVVLNLPQQQMINQGFDSQLLSFVDAIRGGVALQSSGRSVLRSLGAIAAAEASARTGQVIHVPPPAL